MVPVTRIKTRYVFLAYLAGAIALMAAPLRAEVAILEQGLGGYTGAEDTTIFEDNPGNSAGGFPYFFAGVTKAASPRRALLRFNLPATIPAGATITSASLHLYLEFGRPAVSSASLYAMTANWTEGTNPLLDLGTVGQGAPAQMGDATWNRRIYNATPWITPGGDRATVASGSGTATFTDTWTIIQGPGMASDLQTWLVSPASNFGWILIVDEGIPWNAKRFYSSEAGEKRPRLYVEYSAPSTVTGWSLY